MPRVLVVDDEPKICAMIAACLEPDGVEVATAESGEEALALIAQAPPHLAILDVKLKGMSGLEVLQQLHASHPGVAVFILTGYDDDQVERQVKELGALGVIHKPLVLSELRQAILQALKGSG